MSVVVERPSLLARVWPLFKGFDVTLVLMVGWLASARSGDDILSGFDKGSDADIEAMWRGCSPGR